MAGNDDNDIEVKCIFCEKDLDRSEIVRYRGAISCRECADKQKPTSSPMMKPFVYLAGIGCLIGMLNFLLFALHGLLYASINYIQPLGAFFAGMVVTLVTISFGLYAINQVNFHIASIIGMLTALLTAIFSALAAIDFVANGPYFVIEEITYTKTLNYYPTALATISLFCIVAAISILMHISNTKTENVSLASAGMLFVSAGVAMSSWTWLVAGFITAITFALTFAFFVSRKRIFQEEDIQPLSSINGVTKDR
ncbi:hypothetical protein EU528_05750 [Candidatus Thorarchaeota archaeon]|nr:MAG: hypothetical protein EU528_05750 [Candidatus Thorarchaeota archaeon]